MFHIFLQDLDRRNHIKLEKSQCMRECLFQEETYWKTAEMS